MKKTLLFFLLFAVAAGSGMALMAQQKGKGGSEFRAHWTLPDGRPEQDKACSGNDAVENSPNRKDSSGNPVKIDRVEISSTARSARGTKIIVP